MYVYLIDPMPPGALSDTTGRFPQDPPVDAGYSRQQADSIAKKLDGTLRNTPERKWFCTCTAYLQPAVATISRLPAAGYLVARHGRDGADLRAA